MNVKCPCGGRFRRTDFRPMLKHGQTLMVDTDPFVAHWRCDRCRAERKQRKRLPAAKEVKWEVVKL